MAIIYAKAQGPAVDGYSVVKITDDPTYTVIAECADVIAMAMNEAEAA